LDALEIYKTSTHVYSNTFQTLSACGLGDIELRCGNCLDALTHYRRAWRLLKEAPRMVGNARLQIRTSAGLASAYAALGEVDRALGLVAEGLEQLKSVIGQTVTMVFECGLAQLNLGFAVAETRLGRLDEAAGLIQRARETGWLDLPWLENDPEFNPIRSHPTFVSFLEKLRSLPDVEVPVPKRPAVSA
jgi:tetratricopeptide (TPR) repeat protein